MKSMALCLFMVIPLTAQQRALGFQLGWMAANSRETIQLGSRTSFQINYGYRLADLGKAALYGEVHFLANPQRIVGSGVTTATRDVATIFVTPGLKLKFFPSSRVSPYATAGTGLAVFEQSTSQLNGQPNPVPRTINKGAFIYGGGVDLRVVRHFGLRAEVRDFYAAARLTTFLR